MVVSVGNDGGSVCGRPGGSGAAVGLWRVPSAPDLDGWSKLSRRSLSINGREFTDSVGLDFSALTVCEDWFPLLEGPPAS